MRVEDARGGQKCRNSLPRPFHDRLQMITDDWRRVRLYDPTIFFADIPSIFESLELELIFIVKPL